MTDPTEMISAFVALVPLLDKQQPNQPDRAGGIQDPAPPHNDDRAAVGDTKPRERGEVHRQRRQQRIEREVLRVPLLKGVAGDAAPLLIKQSEMQPVTPLLAYPPAQAAKVVGRSYTRIKKAIREKELTARKDGRATLIEHAELQRWLASLPTIGRDPVQDSAHVALPTIARQPVQGAAHVAARDNVGRHAQAHTRPPPSLRPRTLAMSSALEEAPEGNPRR